MDLAHLGAGPTTRDIRLAGLAALHMRARLASESPPGHRAIGRCLSSIVDLLNPPSGLPRVYIAGPYGDGGVANVRKALDVGDAVSDAGGCPVIPHLSALRDLVRPGRSYAHWMMEDMALLDGCRGLVRIEGPSPGAEAEEAHARALGLPIFLSHEVTG